MSANEINSVIDNICTKLGLHNGSVENYWSEVPKAVMANYVSDLVLTAVLLVVCVRVFRGCSRVLDGNDSSFWCMVGCFISAVVAVLCAIILICDVNHVVTCIFAPDVAAFEYIADIISSMY